MSRFSLMAKRNCDELLKRVDPRAVHFEVCDISEHPERGDDDGVYYTPAWTGDMFIQAIYADLTRARSK